MNITNTNIISAKYNTTTYRVLSRTLGVVTVLCNVALLLFSPTLHCLKLPAELTLFLSNW